MQMNLDHITVQIPNPCVITCVASKSLMIRIFGIVLKTPSCCLYVKEHP